MKNFTYGLSVKFVTPLGSFVGQRRFDTSRHDVKSQAGRLFHSEHVNSVCVFDPAGEAHLYLKKTADGVVREELP